jgi:hypothetical protein
MSLFQVVQQGAKICPRFSSESIYAGNWYLENYLISSLIDNCKRKKTPENGYPDSFRLVQYDFRPNRGTGPRCMWWDQHLKQFVRPLNKS